MYSVSLSGLLFDAPIGQYPEERKLLNRIEIDVKLSRDAAVKSLPVLDYEKIYQMISDEVKQPETLLEHLLTRVVQKLKKNFPETLLFVEIRKKNPPFGGRANFASVSWESSNATTSNHQL